MRDSSLNQMHTLSKLAEQFLAARTPDAMSKVLADQSYSRFRTLIYPTPRYRTFLIPKKNGTSREISAPARNLKLVQRKLATILLELYGEGKPSAHAFSKEKSILTNARAHGSS